MMAGAFAGIAVCAALTRAMIGLTAWQEHTVMYPVDLMKVCNPHAGCTSQLR